MVTADELKAQGNAAFSAKNYDQAVEFFTSAIELDPSNHVLYSNRSATYASLGQFNQALADAVKVVEIKPDWAKGYSRKGAALQGLGKVDEAISCFEEGLKIDPENDSLKSALKDAEAQVQQEQSQFGDMFGNFFSNPNLTTLLSLNPSTAPFMKQPDFVEKLKEVQKDPKKLSQHLQDQRMMSVFQFAMQSMLGQGSGVNFDSAEDDGEPEAPKEEPKTEQRAHKEEKPKPKQHAQEDLNPEEKEKREKKQRALEAKNEGNELYKKRKFQDALGKYEEAIDMDPTDMSFHLNKAAVYLEMGEFDSSVKSSEKAIEVGRSVRADYQSIAKAYTRIGNAYSKQTKWDEAIKAYQASLTEFPNDEASKKMKDCVKLKKQQDEKAYLDDAKATEARERGNELFREAKFADAVREYEDSVKRNPNVAAVYSNLAACFAKLGDFPRAIEFCDKCLALDSKFVKAYTRKAGVQFFLKEYHKAIETYKKALELDPENAEAKDGIYRTRVAMQTNMGDEERAKHAMADPEIQAILTDPIIQNVLRDLQQNPDAAQKHLRNESVAARLQKLIEAGIIQTR